MTVLELLEATRVEVDRRWERGVQLWDFDGDCACLLGCVGFAAYGEDFRSEHAFQQELGYAKLRKPEVFPVVVALAANSQWKSSDPMERVYRQNDSDIRDKEQALAFVDQAIELVKSS